MKTCLVVDDSSVIRKVARRILETAGWEVGEAESTQEALERCRLRIPDVVLVDWLSPTGGAGEFIASLRRWPSGKAVRIVYCTTENDPVEISRVLAGGADDFLMKPFDRQSLLAKLEPLPVTA